MWKYSQTSGALTDPAGQVVCIGYSGHGEGINNPDAQSVHEIGPIPQGLWGIGRAFDDIGGKGPCVARLIPFAGTQTFGRSGFMVHGDNRDVDKSASHGCIILPRKIRQMVFASDDRELEVTA